MDTKEIVAFIDEEIARLQQARSILNSLPNTSALTRVPGRLKASFAAAVPVRKKRTMSAEGKARIAEAQRKRWAAKSRA